MGDGASRLVDGVSPALSTDDTAVIAGFRHTQQHVSPKDQLTTAFVGAMEPAASLKSEIFRAARVEKDAVAAALVHLKKDNQDKKIKNISSDLGHCEDFDGLRAHLIKEQNVWSGKKRWFGGKLQGYFHRICRTLDGHRTILEFFPKSNEYVSIFCAAFNTIIQASVNHQEIAERLLEDLSTMGDISSGAAIRVNLFEIELMKESFASLYARIFHFLANAISWYRGGSWTKLRISLDKNFYKRFEDQMKLIARIGTKIEKMAEAGLMVEVQDMDRNLHQVRLGVQDICLDLQDIKREAIIGTQGQARQDAERETRDLLILQELQDFKKMQLLYQVDMRTEVNRQINATLQGLFQSTLQAKRSDFIAPSRPPRRITMPATYESRDVPDSVPQPRTTPKPPLGFRADLELSSQHLEAHILGAEIAEALLFSPPALSLSTTMFDRLQSFVADPASTTLWLAGPFAPQYPSKMSTVAATLISTLSQPELEPKPTLIFAFCALPPIKSFSRTDCSREEVGALSCVYALLRQLVLSLPPEFPSCTQLSKERFTALDGTMDTFPAALELLKGLLTIVAPYTICIVDGLDRLDYRKGAKACKEFVETLKAAMVSEAFLGKDDNQSSAHVSAAGGGERVLKALFTTAGKSGTLMRGLEARDIALEDERKGSIDLWKVSPGQKAVGGLRSSLPSS